MTRHIAIGLTRKSIILTGIIGISACAGHASPPASSTETATTAAAEPSGQAAETPSQVERGMALYVEHCAECHGEDGRGTDKAPAVVGEGALSLRPPQGAKRDAEFATAGDVLRWVRTAMPGDAPGSLSAPQYAAILAFALHANGVDMTGVHLDEARADAIRLH